MTEEGTITPEVKIKELEEALETQTERLTKLYAAYETQDKELIDLRAEVEVLEKEIIDREIEKESLDSILREKENKIRELEMKATKASKQVSHLQPELDKMEEKYSREKDRLGKVFSIAEELDNDLKLALVEMRARDEWYVSHMSLFEDLNKAIQQRYEMIESRVEAERQSQHMGQVFSDRMDELVEARAAEIADSPAPAESDEQEWDWSQTVVDRIVDVNSIEDVDAFMEFAKAYDADNNKYLKTEELERAAVDWVAQRNQVSLVEVVEAPVEESSEEVVEEAESQEEVVEETTPEQEEAPAEPAQPQTWGDDVDPWEN